MKTIEIILTVTFLSLSMTMFGQSQKKAVDFENEDFERTIQHTFDSLKTDLDLSWVYYKIANFDTTYHTNTKPPPPNFITSFGFSDFELEPMDFENVKILKENPEKIFKENENQLDSENAKRKKEFGNGLVFSLPYSNLSENGKFVDIEVINWDWCGTGAELRIKLKE